jgi:formate transporter
MDSTVIDTAPGADAPLPPEMAQRAERVGVQKTRLDTLSLLTLAVLAGAFIGFGAMLSTIVVAGANGTLPYGVSRILSGLVFSLGLILVIVGGAELFTGNNLMVMAWASGRVRIAEVLRAWAVVYCGNLVGAVATAVFVFAAQEHFRADGQVGAAALAIAQSKAALEFFPAMVGGILANVLVCLAVWLCHSARTTTDKIVAIVPPVTAFVAAGFEHSVANMYLIPSGMLVKYGAPEAFWTSAGLAPDAYPALAVTGFVSNLVPVTIGNIIGGALLVGAVYWFVYLRGRPQEQDSTSARGLPGIE